MFLTNIESPNIHIKMLLRKFFAKNQKVATAFFKLNTGSFEKENIDSKTASIHSNLGGVELKCLNDINLSLETRQYAITPILPSKALNA